tara:strand:+ start:1394 stop:3394 length:2001 start_codon:yes stop_codon:yes gene_type:complete
MAKLTASLSISSDVYGGKNSNYTATHPVSSVFDTTFKVNNADGLRELIEFKPDGTKTFNKFNFLVLSNEGQQPAEIQILLREFGVDDDIVDANPESGTIDFILNPGKYIALPTSKMILYSADHDDNDVYAASDLSAGNKAGTSAYNTAYATTGPTFIDPPGYFIASQTNAATEVKTLNSGNFFEADIEEDFFKNQGMGPDTTGHAEADHIALFGECHADEVGTLQTISAIDSDGTYANTRLTGSIGNDVSSATGTYIGAYASVARLNGAHTASVTTITFENNAGSDGSADGQMFKKYDIIRVGNELMQITGGVPHQTTFTVKRGVLGTTAAAHADQDAIGFHYMHDVLEYLDSTDGTSKAATAGCAFMKGVSNIYTNANGSFSANTFFGLGRDFALPSGLVPGSIALKFYSPARKHLGMTGIRSSISTGLAANTAYEFKITFDGTAEQTISFTTDASNTQFGNSLSGTGVLKKIQDALDANSVIDGDVRIGIFNGDVVLTTKTRYRGLSSITLAAGSTGTAELFGTGKFPAVTAHKPLISPQLPADDDLDNMMFDDGMGHLLRTNGGSGIINYETGAFQLNGCPPNAHMQVACNFNSALSGNLKSTRENVVPVIKARSLNAYRDAFVRVLAYDDIIDDDNVEILMGGTESDGSNFRQATNPNTGRY